MFLEDKNNLVKGVLVIFFDEYDEKFNDVFKFFIMDEEKLFMFLSQYIRGLSENLKFFYESN